MSADKKHAAPSLSDEEAWVVEALRKALPEASDKRLQRTHINMPVGALRSLLEIVDRFNN